MYYEIYIDVLFLVNFMMDALLLLLVGKILKCSAGYGRIFLGAFAGSAISCVLIVIPLPFPIFKMILFHTAVNSCMIVVAFQVKKKNLFFKAFLLLYICAFLMGGILQWLFPYLRTGSVFFAAAVLAYFLVNGIWKFVSTLSSKQQKMYRVTLFMGAWKQEVLAWLDTGNGLKDPLTGQPVHVLDPSAAEEFMKDRALEGVRYIPFRTIQGEGVMPAIRIEKMCIQTLPDKTKVFKADSKEKQTEIWVNKPVIGISRERIFAREDYQMLLNPEGLGGI